ncbi:AMP-binding protein [Actinomadura sp. HBU206391]|uniref:AMP-binding protein n=1 Tax=Actinomadura sp. HBU206391 TaxID=2731692 RepID=UPI0016500DAD|nr:AMP-binding protein [Actinomadura sp. HBU206391]MBC6459948.1 AMP-binding protein [Actinomadura sp. HBU206391]
MSSYDERPWLARYDDGQPTEIEIEHTSALRMFAASVARDPDADIIRYFDGRITLRELDELSDAFAAGLAATGFAAQDRVALYLQNVPQFVIAMVGTWKAGGIAVSANPMNKERELELLLRDSGAKVLVCLQGLYRDVARHVVAGTEIRTVITTSELEYETRDDQWIFSGVEPIECPGTVDMARLLGRFAGHRPPAVPVGPDDVAFLTYTSGTTGPPKGAMTTHRNVVFNAQAYRDWIAIGSEDVILGVGVPDEYRGETVKAYVSLRPGMTAEPAELIAFCKERMAAYKCPRAVEILEEIPKTVTGKLLRRELRARY